MLGVRQQAHMTVEGALELQVLFDVHNLMNSSNST